MAEYPNRYIILSEFMIMSREDSFQSQLILKAGQKYND